MTVTPLDRSVLPLDTTASLEPVERQVAAPPSGGVIPSPGRYLAIEEDGGQRLMALTRPIVHLGRGFASTIQVEDAAVSRRHAILVQRRTGVRILDDRSANGTFVNGRRVTEADLRDGDVIVVGETVLVYLERGDGAAQVE